MLGEFSPSFWGLLAIPAVPWLVGTLIPVSVFTWPFILSPIFHIFHVAFSLG